MIDSTRASSVWSSVALVAVRVMMAVTTYILELCLCCGFCSWWTTWKLQRLTVNMLASGHYLHAKCLVQVAHP